MPSKLQKERRKKVAMMIYKIERLQLSSKVVGDDCWQEKNSKGFEKRLRNCPFNLFVIRGRIILKREGMIRSKKGQIRILTWEVHLSSFTATVIILNPIIGSSWNFTWSLLTWFPTLGYNFRSIGVWKGIKTRVNIGCMNFVIYFILTCGLPIWLGFFS